MNGAEWEETTLQAKGKEVVRFASQPGRLCQDCHMEMLLLVEEVLPCLFNCTSGPAILSRW